MHKNQHDIVRFLLQDDVSRIKLMMPVRMTNNNSVEVMMDCEKPENSTVPLVKCKDFGRKVYGYFLSIIDLSAELCLGRNKEALENLQELFSYDTVKNIVTDKALPFDLRALFMRVLLYMHMDREPLEAI